MNCPASSTLQPATVVHLLAKRPELRDVFPVADAIDMVVRAGV